MAQGKTFKTTLLIAGKLDKSLQTALKATESRASKTAKKISGVMKKAAKTIGVTMVAGVGAATVAIGALGVAAVKNAAQMETQMQNVATLLDGTAAEVAARTSELSEDVLRVSNNTGITTTDLTSGMYDVISAVGDTEDSIKILETSAKAAAAGNAQTSEAVSLLTAVTKGYGDTSSEAFEKASDLAFQTVKLGQTTFPELASSIGKVTPIASALGVQQEELFGVFATLTGVTGSAAEVATQYKGVLAGLMTPSEAMSDALKELGYETGSAAIESLGFQGTLTELMGTVDGDVQTMAKLFSSVEAQTAVLSLCGAQTDNLTAKTQAMRESTGATTKAFETQTDNMEYTIQMIKNLGDNFLTSVGTKILPYVKDLAEKLLPKVEEGIDVLLPIIDDIGAKAQEYIPQVVEMIQGFQPVLENIGAKAQEHLPKVIDVIKNIGETVQSVMPSVLEVIDDIAVTLRYFAENDLPKVVDFSEKVFDAFLKIAGTVGQWDGLKTAVQLLAAAYVSWKITRTVGDTLKLMRAFAVLRVEKMKDMASTLYLNALYAKDAVVKAASAAATAALAVKTGIATAATVVWQGVCAAATAVTTALGAAFTFLTSPIGLVIIAIAAVIAVGVLLYKNWDQVCEVAQKLWDRVKILAEYVQMKAVAAWNTFLEVIQNTTYFQNLMTIVDTVKAVFENLIDFVKNVFTGNWQGAWQNIVNIFDSIFSGIANICTRAINGCLAPINAVIRGVNKVREATGAEPISEITFGGFAKGGTVSSPTLAWVGEGGDEETIIPHNNSPRSRALLQTAARGVYGSGAATGGRSVNVTYAPVIYGGGQSVKEELREDFERFKEFFGQYEDEDDREVFA